MKRNYGLASCQIDPHQCNLVGCLTWDSDDQRLMSALDALHPKVYDIYPPNRKIISITNIIDELRKQKQRRSRDLNPMVRTLLSLYFINLNV